MKKPDYAPLIDRLLWVKKEYEVFSGNELLVKTKLITMSPDDQHEEEIEVGWWLDKQPDVVIREAQSGFFKDAILRTGY